MIRTIAFAAIGYATLAKLGGGGTIGIPGAVLGVAIDYLLP